MADPRSKIPSPSVLAQPQATAIDTGAIVLTPDRLAEAQQALAGLDFERIAAADVVKIGFASERGLQRTLDGFLSRLDDKTASRVFDLFGRLERDVADAKLPEVLDRIQNGDKAGLIGSLVSRLTGKSAEDRIRDFMEEVSTLVSGRSRTLADKMQALEGDLNRQMQALMAELTALDALKQAYAGHFADFTLDAAVARAFLDKARATLAARAAAATPGDLVEQAALRALQDKLHLLESRALALEGVYTRLPADQLVIQQIEQAGLTTLQETATTIAARFASIKITLLSLHSAFAVKAVQQISERQKKMDDQLTRLRDMAVKDVAVSAARAPGDNRLAQAQQIEQIIAATREIHALVGAARRQTAENFDIARQTFAKARQDLATLDEAQT